MKLNPLLRTIALVCLLQLASPWSCTLMDHPPCTVNCDELLRKKEEAKRDFQQAEANALAKERDVNAKKNTANAAMITWGISGAVALIGCIGFFAGPQCAFAIAALVGTTANMVASQLNVQEAIREASRAKVERGIKQNAYNEASSKHLECLEKCIEDCCKPKKLRLDIVVQDLTYLNSLKNILDERLKIAEADVKAATEETSKINKLNSECTGPANICSDIGKAKAAGDSYLSEAQAFLASTAGEISAVSTQIEKLTAEQTTLNGELSVCQATPCT